MLVVQEFASHRSLLLKDSCTSVSLHKCVKGTLAKVVFCCLTPRGNPSESVQLGVRRSCQVTEKEKKQCGKQTVVVLVFVWGVLMYTTLF